MAPPRIIRRPSLHAAHARIARYRPALAPLIDARATILGREVDWAAAPIIAPSWPARRLAIALAALLTLPILALPILTLALLTHPVLSLSVVTLP